MKRDLMAFVLASVMFAAAAYPATPVTADQGSPGTRGPWPVTISGSGSSTVVVGPDGGAVVVQDAPCNSPLETYFVPSTTDAGTCPPTALAGRSRILLCNAPKNVNIATAPFITVTIDGQAPTNTLPSPGQELGLGDCITYVAGSGLPVHCISDTVDAGLLITECK